jgi:hypothetical protein
MRLYKLHSQLMIDVSLQNIEIYRGVEVMRFMRNMKATWRAILRFTNGTAGSRSEVNQPVTGTSVLG